MLQEQEQEQLSLFNQDGESHQDQEVLNFEDFNSTVKNSQWFLAENIDLVKTRLMEASLDQLSEAQTLETVVEIIEWMLDRKATHSTCFQSCCKLVRLEPGRLAWYAVDSLRIGSPLFKITAKRLVTEVWGYDPSLDASD